MESPLVQFWGSDVGLCHAPRSEMTLKLCWSPAVVKQVRMRQFSSSSHRTSSTRPKTVVLPNPGRVLSRIGENKMGDCLSKPPEDRQVTGHPTPCTLCTVVSRFGGETESLHGCGSVRGASPQTKQPGRQRETILESMGGGPWRMWSSSLMRPESTKSSVGSFV